jgi:peptidoglycan hydrolase-like protein with peptidoglycan-binding domain
MIPLIPIGAAAAAFWWFFGRKPASKDFQVTNVIGKGGIPVKVATPIPKGVTMSQATGRGAASPAGTSKTTTQHGATSAPAGSMVQLGPGSYQVPPIVITPTGASSVAVGTVLDTQRALNTLGYSPRLSEDGKLGPATIRNIKAFQSASHLAVDGNAGPATKAALSSAITALASGGSGAPAGAAADGAWASESAGATPAPAAQAVKISSATAMTAQQIQSALNALGTSPPLTVDGKMGPRSIAAIKSFQLSHGLVADGVAGPKTKIALQTAVISGPEGMTVDQGGSSVAGEGTFSCGWS